jgi:hypothetical protein
MLNDADGQGGGNASDYEARETIADAEAFRFWGEANIKRRQKPAGTAENGLAPFDLDQ